MTIVEDPWTILQTFGRMLGAQPPEKCTVPPGTRSGDGTGCQSGSAICRRYQTRVILRRVHVESTLREGDAKGLLGASLDHPAGALMTVQRQQFRKEGAAEERRYAPRPLVGG